MVLEMLMESVFAVVDIYWVSHLEGVATDAVATVGLTESMLTLVYALAIGLSIGAMAMVARRIGEENPEGAARAAVQAPGASGRFHRHYDCFLNSGSGECPGFPPWALEETSSLVIFGSSDSEQSLSGFVTFPQVISSLQHRLPVHSIGFS